MENSEKKKRGRPKGSKDSVPRKRTRKPYEASLAVGGLKDSVINVQPGDNAKYMSINMQLFNLPDFDVHSATPEEVDVRINEFFKIFLDADVKPTLAGLAIALGINRGQINAIAHDQPIDGGGYRSTLPHETAGKIKKAHRLMENYWEIYMNSGKINPVTGIFLGKNNYGYADKTEYVVTPNASTADDSISLDEIKQRYQIDDSDSDSEA